MQCPSIILLAALIVFAGENAYSQLQSGELYGVAWYQHVNSITAGFASFDPITGTSHGISELYSGINFGGAGSFRNRCRS